MEQMFKRKVLFVCIHNAARSQMAQAFLNTVGGEYFEAESAGMEPTAINPLAVEVMAEKGIDISRAEPRSVFDLVKKGKEYGYVITVCDEAAQRCPVFPFTFRRIHWNLEDPAGFQGSHEERLEQTRKVRDEIESRVNQFVHEFQSAIEAE